MTKPQLIRSVFSKPSDLNDESKPLKFLIKFDEGPSLVILDNESVKCPTTMFTNKFVNLETNEGIQSRIVTAEKLSDNEVKIHYHENDCVEFYQLVEPTVLHNGL